ncbi:hypothetical protein EJP67_29660 [Variovorax guangxiensis]|uniref:Sulfur globule protein n=1 Tax=Variovorax guangxiensis TaxID=1775474 RepID=A0A3S0XK27_9BURK|nr:hypothetical protein [Variovorax guangxiensis]RUR71218.1 hypothetical protein EJP67_29660 [Variovorax guangxiensis]
MKKAILFGVLCIAVFASPLAIAKGGGGGRIAYGGGHHSASHGGSYSGGQGSSHRGGTYRNSRTGNQYGTHK